MARDRKYPITGKSRKEPDPIVQTRKQARRDFTDAISEHGGDKDCYPRATKRVESRVFRSGRPDGKRDEWDKEDQQRISIGEKAAEKRIRGYGAQGNHEVIEQAGNGAADANRDMNEKGVQSVWEWFFNPKSIWDVESDPPTPEPAPEVTPEATSEDGVEETTLLHELGSLAKWFIGM